MHPRTKVFAALFHPGSSNIPKECLGFMGKGAGVWGAKPHITENI